MTSKAKAEAILKDGFRDASKQYLSDQEWTGVWVSDAPFWQDEGMTLFAIEVPDDAISEFEWAEEGKTISEWLVPASLLNQYGPPVVTDDADGDDDVAELFGRALALGVLDRRLHAGFGAFDLFCRRRLDSHSR